VSYVKFWETKVISTLGDLIMKVLDCIVTISFGVYLVMWLFLTRCVMCGCV
jgi:hypothetical protein